MAIVLTIIILTVFFAVGTAWYYLDQHLDDISTDMEEQAKQFRGEIADLKFELKKVLRLPSDTSVSR
jgi:hypothetical protein